MTKLGYLGIDQHGQKYQIDKHPRKELMEQIGRSNASKMYVDTKEGTTKHTGYIVGGLWVSIYEVHEWKGKV